MSKDLLRVIADIEGIRPKKAKSGYSQGYADACDFILSKLRPLASDSAELTSRLPGYGMENEIKIQGLFVWAILDTERAEQIYHAGTDSIFRLHNDGTEMLCVYETDLVVDHEEILLGVQVGNLDELQQEHEAEAANIARNNSPMSFDEWLDRKITNLIE